MFLNLSGFNLVYLLVAIVISLTIHEAMHGYVAHWLGDMTAYHSGRLTLNPLKHIDLTTTVFLPIILISLGLQPFFAAKPVPFDSHNVKYGDFGVALVGIAGPVINLLIAIISGVIIKIFLQNLDQTVLNFLVILIEVNIGFFIFNMIPFPPLDGSRLLYAFSPEIIQRIMRQIESYGFVAIIVFMIFIFQFISGPIINLESGLLNLILKL